MPDLGRVVGRIPSGRILFGVEKSQRTIAIAWLDSGGIHVIPGTGDARLANAVWATEDTVVLDRKASGDRRNVFALPIAGGELVPLTHDPTTGEEKAAVSADGTTIAYEHYVAGSNEDLGINVASPIGSTAWGLEPPAEPIKGGDTEVALSGDGSRLAFVNVPVWDMPGAALVLSDARKGGRMLLVDATMDAGHPRFSPDGSLVLFTQGLHGGAHDGPLWVAPVDGSKPRPLAGPGDGLWAFEADWSPDGASIVFKVTGSGWDHNELWIAHADGSDPYPVWVGSSEMTAETPDWGP